MANCLSHDVCKNEVAQDCKMELGPYLNNRHGPKQCLRGSPIERDDNEYLLGGGSDGAASVKNCCLTRTGHIWGNASMIGLGASAMPK